MTKEQWQTIVENIEENFTIEDRRQETTEDEAGTVDVLEFLGPLGLMKLEFMERPKVVDRKMIVSKRIGSEGKEENVYDETQTVYTLKAYRWDDDADLWQEMEAENLNF